MFARKAERLARRAGGQDPHFAEIPPRYVLNISFMDAAGESGDFAAAVRPQGHACVLIKLEIVSGLEPCPVEPDRQPTCTGEKIYVRGVHRRGRAYARIGGGNGLVDRWTSCLIHLSGQFLILLSCGTASQTSNESL